MTMQHGRVLYAPPPPGERRGKWGLDVVPHVAIRVKRMFPRAEQARTGVIVMVDTPEIARDIEWLLHRYELEVTPSARHHIRTGAAAFRKREEIVERALAGYVPPDDWREPARPARDYQLVADAMIAATGGLLLLDELGLGKTYTSLLRLRDPSALPAVVVCLTNLPTQWGREIDLTLPWLEWHIVTRGTPYNPTHVRGGTSRPPDVLIVNYAKLAGWADYLAGRVNTVIFDEVQELRRAGTIREPTQKYAAARRVAWDAKFRYGLSATPIYNYGGEMHNIVEIIQPGMLGDRGEFVREWGAGKREGGSVSSSDEAHVGDPRALGTYLRESGVMLRRTRKEVGRELPAAIPIIHEVSVDPDELDDLLVKGGVDAFAKTLVDRDAGRQDRFLAAGEFDMRMRQATGIAKAPYVAQFVKMLLESGEKVVVGAWHRAVYEVLLEELEDYHPVMYTGSESPKQKNAAFDAIIGDDEVRVMLMSLRSGAGLDGLQVASHVAVFAELDWSPGVHSQFIGRLARDGMGDDPVLAYYVVSDDGSDPVVMDVLGVKRRQSEPMTDPDAPLGVIGEVDPDRIRRMAERYLEGKRRR